MPSTPDRPVFLVGFMGSGKTEVGRSLAASRGWVFVDTDALVESLEGRSIESIFREAGEGSFREAEWRVLQELGDARRTVVATGGGLFLGLVQRKLMKRLGFTVWLDVTLEEARARLGEGVGRPLWAGVPPEEIRATYERRRATYALADLRVAVTGLSPEEVADHIEERFRALSR